jgi:outer membrane protein OmpA-like peptidoglycan-associated protein
MVAGVPSLKVYFDTGKADIAPEFSERALPLVEYAKANANAKLVVSGFNDPTGDAAANEELSKNRAMAVAAALKAAGVSESSIVLEKPAVATGTGDTNAESRRVEVTVRN